MLAADVGFIIDDGDVGYEEIGDQWQDSTVTGTYMDDSRYHVASSGSAEARWMFTDLEAGDYEVLASWGADPNRTENALFLVSTASQQSAVAVNQQVAPHDDAWDEGVSFQRIVPSVEVGANGTLTVRLQEDSEDIISADAVWVRPLAPTRDIMVSGNGVSIVDGDDTPSTSNDTDFGIVFKNQISARTYTVTNGGEETLTLGSVSVPIGYSLIEGLVTSLAPGDSDTFTVGLDTSSSANKSGEIVFASSDNGPFNFAITATVERYIIDDGDAGYEEIGDLWLDSTVTDTYQGDSRYHIADSGSAEARWEFTDLVAGDYEVLASWGADPNRTQNALHLISTASQQSAVAVNQKVAPREDALQDGVPFQILSSSVAVGANGALTVRLQEDVEHIISADAMWVRRLVPPRDVIVTGNGVPIVDGDDTPSTSDHTDFGTLFQNQGAARTYTVTNGAESTLTLGEVNVPAGFSLVEGLVTSLDAGDSDTFTLAADTSSMAIGSGEIVFSSSDNGPFNFTIRAAVENYIIDDGDEGYEEIGDDWRESTVTDTYNDDSRYHVASSGSAQARWMFTDLEAGDYEVLASWGADPNRTQNALYLVSSAGQQSAVAVNQKHVPRDDAWDEEVPFQLIVPSLEVGSNGSLTVRLMENAEEIISADAVWVRLRTDGETSSG